MCRREGEGVCRFMVATIGSVLSSAVGHTSNLLGMDGIAEIDKGEWAIASKWGTTIALDCSKQYTLESLPSATFM